VVTVSTGYNHSCALSRHRLLVCWGTVFYLRQDRNQYELLELEELIPPSVRGQIDLYQLGFDTTCAKTIHDQRSVCWGNGQ